MRRRGPLSTNLYSTRERRRKNGACGRTGPVHTSSRDKTSSGFFFYRISFLKKKISVGKENLNILVMTKLLISFWYSVVRERDLMVTMGSRRGNLWEEEDVEAGSSLEDKSKVVSHEMKGERGEEWSRRRKGQSVRDTRYLTPLSRTIPTKSQQSDSICSRQKRRDPSVCFLWLVPTDIPSEVMGYISSSLFLFTILLSKWLNQINPARELFNAFQSTGLLSFGFRNSDLLLHLITYFLFHPQELECLHLLGRRRWRFLTEIFTPPHMQERPFQGNNLPSSRLFFQLYHYTFTPRRKVWLALKTRGKMFYTTRALNDWKIK